MSSIHNIRLKNKRVKLGYSHQEIAENLSITSKQVKKCESRVYANNARDWIFGVVKRIYYYFVYRADAR